MEVILNLNYVFNGSYLKFKFMSLWNLSILNLNNTPLS